MLWILLIFLILTLIWFSSVRIGIFYKREQENDLIKVEVGLLNGLIPIRKEIPALNFKEEGIQLKERTKSKKKTTNKEKKRITYAEIKEYRKQFNQWVDQVVYFHRILKNFLAKIKVKKLSWWSRIGTGDAAETGILSGLVWGIKSGLITVIRHFLQMKKEPEIIIEPSFMQACLHTQFECIVQFRLGDAILAGIKFMINWKKGRGARWQNTQFKV